MDIGELELTLKLDRAQFDRQIAALSREKFPNITTSIGFNPTSTLSTVKKSLATVQTHLNTNPLTVRVDHKPLHQLNAHLDLKKKHLKETIDYFNNNPIKPKIDKSALNSMAVKINATDVQTYLNTNPLTVRVDHKPLQQLNAHLDLKKKHLKKTIDYFNNNLIKPKIDKSALNSMAVKVNATDERRNSFFRNPRALNYSEATSHRKADFSIELKGIDSTLREILDRLGGVTRAIDRNTQVTKPPGLFSKIIDFASFPLKESARGGFQEIGASFARGSKLSKFSNQSGKKLVELVDRVAGEIIGLEDYLANLLGELITSGNFQKATDAANSKLKITKEIERLGKLALLASTPRNANYVENVKRADANLGDILQTRLNKASGASAKAKVIEGLIKELQDESKGLIEKVVNPTLEDLSATIRFVSKIQSYRTVNAARKEADRLRPLFPILKEGEAGILNIVGGAMFKKGEGGRMLQASFESTVPHKRVLPVQNPDTDPGGKATGVIEKYILETIRATSPDAFKSIDFQNTLVNAIRSITTAFDPNFISKAVVQSVANALVASSQGVKPKDISTLTYSLGGAEGIRTAAALSHLGMDESQVLAMAYPFLGAAKLNLPNFKSTLLKTDPLNFGYDLGVLPPSNQLLFEGGKTKGFEAHAYKHLFKKNPEFLELFNQTMGMSVPTDPQVASKYSDFLHASSGLYELLGSLEQTKSLLSSGEFNSDALFKGFMTNDRVTALELFTKLAESAADTGRFAQIEEHPEIPPEMVALARTIPKIVNPIVTELAATLRSAGAALPENAESADIYGYLKLQSEGANTLNKAIRTFKTGVLPEGEDVYFAGNLVQKTMQDRMRDFDLAIDYFRKAPLGIYKDKIIQAFSSLKKVAAEFADTGRLSDKTIASLQEIELDTISSSFYELGGKSINPYELKGFEEAREYQFDAPNWAKQTPAAVLAYNKIAESMQNVGLPIPAIKEFEKAAYGMSGAASLLTEKLVYKTDINDPEKIASKSEIAAYTKLQGEYAPQLLAHRKGEFLVSERIIGTPVKNILDELAAPALKLKKERDEIAKEIGQITKNDSSLSSTVRRLVSLQGRLSVAIARGDANRIKALQTEIDAISGSIAQLGGEAPRLIELVRGRSEIVAQYQKEKQKFNDEAEKLYARIGQLGSTFHSLGVAHNDLASANVFITPDDGIKAIDFGNSTVNPASRDKLNDRLTTIQRAIIDRAYWGLLDAIRQTKAINRGYNQTPLPKLNPQAIDKNLLIPKVSGGVVPLGSLQGKFLDTILGKDYEETLAEIKENYAKFSENKPLEREIEDANRLPQGNSGVKEEPWFKTSIINIERSIKNIESLLQNNIVSSQTDTGDLRGGGAIKTPSPTPTPVPLGEALKPVHHAEINTALKVPETSLVRRVKDLNIQVNYQTSRALIAIAPLVKALDKLNKAFDASVGTVAEAIPGVNLFAGTIKHVLLPAFKGSLLKSVPLVGQGLDAIDFLEHLGLDAFLSHWNIPDLNFGELPLDNTELFDGKGKLLNSFKDWINDLTGTIESFVNNGTELTKTELATLVNDELVAAVEGKMGNEALSNATKILNTPEKQAEYERVKESARVKKLIADYVKLSKEIQNTTQNIAKQEINTNALANSLKKLPEIRAYAEQLKARSKLNLSQPIGNPVYDLERQLRQMLGSITLIDESTLTDRLSSIFSKIDPKTLDPDFVKQFKELARIVDTAVANQNIVYSRAQIPQGDRFTPLSYSNYLLGNIRGNLTQQRKNIQNTESEDVKAAAVRSFPKLADRSRTALNEIEKIFKASYSEKQFDKNFKSIFASARREITNLLKEVDRAKIDSSKITESIVNGLIEGFEDSSKLYEAMRLVSQGLIDEAKNVLDIHSPSKKFEELAKNCIEGLEKGLTADDIFSGLESDILASFRNIDAVLKMIPLMVTKAKETKTPVKTLGGLLYSQTHGGYRYDKIAGDPNKAFPNQEQKIDLIHKTTLNTLFAIQKSGGMTGKFSRQFEAENKFLGAKDGAWYSILMPKGKDKASSDYYGDITIKFDAQALKDYITWTPEDSLYTMNNADYSNFYSLFDRVPTPKTYKEAEYVEAQVYRNTPLTEAKSVDISRLKIDLINFLDLLEQASLLQGLPLTGASIAAKNIALSEISYGTPELTPKLTKEDYDRVIKGALAPLFKSLKRIGINPTSLVPHTIDNKKDYKDYLSFINKQSDKPTGKSLELTTKLADRFGLTKELDRALSSNLETRSVGRNIVLGIITGLNKDKGRAFAAVASIGIGILTTIKQVLGIRSPSTEFEEMGGNCTEGLEKGIKKGNWRANIAALISSWAIGAKKIGADEAKKLAILVNEGFNANLNLKPPSTSRKQTDLKSSARDVIAYLASWEIGAKQIGADEAKKLAILANEGFNANLDLEPPIIKSIRNWAKSFDFETKALLKRSEDLKVQYAALRKDLEAELNKKLPTPKYKTEDLFQFLIKNNRRNDKEIIDDKPKDKEPNGRHFKDFIKSFLTKAIIGVTGIVVFKSLFSNLFQSISTIVQSEILDLNKLIQTGIEYQSLTIKLSFIGEKGESIDSTLENIKNKANEKGLGVFNYANNIVSFKRSIENTSLESRGSDLFEGFATGMAGLSNEATERGFAAITQMAGKGTVSLEELRGQLAEAVPGSMTIAARSMGLTNAELMELVANGQVMADELLPKLSQGLRYEGLARLAAYSESGSASFQKLSNEFALFQGKLGSSTLSDLKPVFDGLSGVIDFLSNNLTILRDIIFATTTLFTGYVVKSWLEGIGAIDRVTGQFINRAKTLKNLQLILSSLGTQLAVVAALYVGFNLIGETIDLFKGSQNVQNNIATVRASLKLLTDDYKKAAIEANKIYGKEVYKVPSEPEEPEKKSKNLFNLYGVLDRPTSGNWMADFFYDPFTLRGRKPISERRSDQRLTAGEQDQLVESEKTEEFLNSSQEQLTTALKNMYDPQKSADAVAKIREIDQSLRNLKAERTYLSIQPTINAIALEGIDKQLAELTKERNTLISVQFAGGEAGLNQLRQQFVDRKTELTKLMTNRNYANDPNMQNQMSSLDNKIAAVDLALDTWKSFSSQINSDFNNVAAVLYNATREAANLKATAQKINVRSKLDNYSDLRGYRLQLANQKADVQLNRTNLDNALKVLPKYDLSKIRPEDKTQIEKITGKSISEVTNADIDYVNAQLGENAPKSALDLLKARRDAISEIRELKLTLAQSVRELAESMSEEKGRILNLNTERASASLLGSRQRLERLQGIGYGGQFGSIFLDRQRLELNRKEVSLLNNRIGAGSSDVRADLSRTLGREVKDVRKLSLGEVEFLTKVEDLLPESKAVVSNLSKVQSLNKENLTLAEQIARATFKGLDELARTLASLQLNTSIVSFRNQINNLNSPTLNQEVFGGSQQIRSTRRSNAQELVSQQNAFEDFVRSIRDLVYSLNTQIAALKEEIVKTLRQISVDRIGGDIAAITALGFNGIVSQIGGRIQEIFSEGANLLSSDQRPQLKRDLQTAQRDYEKQIFDFNRQQLSLNTSVDSALFDRAQSNREIGKTKLELDQRQEMSVDELKATAIGLRQQQIEYNRSVSEAENLASQSGVKISIPRSTSVIPTDFEIESAGTESWAKLSAIYEEQIALNNEFAENLRQIQANGTTQINRERAIYEQSHREFVGLKEDQIRIEGERIQIATDNLSKKITAVVVSFGASLEDALLAANQQLEDIEFSSTDFLNQFRSMPYNERLADVPRQVGKRFTDQRRQYQSYSTQLGRFIQESEGKGVDQLIADIAGSDAIAPELRDKLISELGQAKTVEQLNAIVDRYRTIKTEVDTILNVGLGKDAENAAIAYERAKIIRQNKVDLAQSRSSLNADIYNEYLTGNRNQLNPFDRNDLERQIKLEGWDAEYVSRKEGYYQSYDQGKIDLPTLTNFLAELERLNEFKLENINQEFDLLGRTIEDTFGESFKKGFTDLITGKASINEFLDSIVSAFANAAADIVSTWVQSQISSLIFGGTNTLLNPIAVAGFNDGGEVEIKNFAKGGAVEEDAVAEATSATPIVRLGMGVIAAMRREGANAVPIVAHKGEQILTTRNGDAQFYRLLQASGQWARLKQNKYEVNNYSTGGTVGYNPNLSEVRVRSTQSKDRAAGNITINVITPNADSFRKAEGQIRRDTAFELDRMRRRNG